MGKRQIYPPPVLTILIVQVPYEAFNARDIAVAEELFAPDFVSHAPGTVRGLRESLTSLFTSYPDIHDVVEDQLVDGDKFALRMTIQGIPRAPEGPQPVMTEPV